MRKGMKIVSKVEMIKKRIIELYFNDIDPYNKMSDEELVEFINNDFDEDITIKELEEIRGW